ncbi:hypothetical protein K470DRAFT_270739 [Piedraia hortae CBS 480.64]|uniref:Uncharacterized protein n=1 Tax=Piedraia hortae CBS 480.64 TaxID=1314780 RepID=A0A6A7BZ39_9PEZI|nr:hypothetical protein K470DRAFT_270739 [Piedraia hortae CBS 480.64]
MDAKSTSFEVSLDGECTFSGKAQNLPSFLMHIRLKELLDSDLRDQAIKCAYAANQLRGRAQEWITRLKHTTSVAYLIAELEGLADQLNWPAQARRAVLYQALKPSLRVALVLCDIESYDELEQQAYGGPSGRGNFDVRSAAPQSHALGKELPRESREMPPLWPDGPHTKKLLLKGH